MNCKSCKVKNCDKFKCTPEDENADWAYNRAKYREDYAIAYGGNVVARNPKVNNKYVTKFSNRRMDSVSKEARMR